MMPCHAYGGLYRVGLQSVWRLPCYICHKHVQQKFTHIALPNHQTEDFRSNGRSNGSWVVLMLHYGTCYKHKACVPFQIWPKHCHGSAQIREVAVGCNHYDNKVMPVYALTGFNNAVWGRAAAEYFQQAKMTVQCDAGKGTNCIISKQPKRLGSQAHD